MLDALDIVVIGAVGVDTNVFLAGADVDFSIEVNFSENRDYVGQAGGFASRGFAQLGKRTGFIGYIGEDTALLEELMERGRVVYHEDVRVFHRRRAFPGPYLRQRWRAPGRQVRHGGGPRDPQPSHPCPSWQ